MIQNGFEYNRYNLDADGTFNVTTSLCYDSATVHLRAVDVTTMRQSAPVFYTLVPGENMVGNITACGASSGSGFLTYTLDGSTTYTSFFPPADSLLYLYDSPTHSIFISGTYYFFAQVVATANFSYDETTAGPGITQPMKSFYAKELNRELHMSGNAGTVTFTEYGTVGEFIAGSFVTEVINSYTGTSHTASGSFRIYRSF